MGCINALLCGNEKLYKILVGKYEGKVSLDRSRQR
jgi:hypothetical protein